MDKNAQKHRDPLAYNARVVHSSSKCWYKSY